jgi:mono/diheme cytochrome c family protein
MIRAAAVAVAVLVSSAGCATEGGDASGDPENVAATILQASIPERLAGGEAAFNANCSSCHGERGLGTAQGPPLVHIIYEPSHHGDIAFLLAVERGVRAHHWSFGDMPPQPTVSREQVDEITAYVRHLQRLVGIS